jgi:hypothetical protein
MRVVDNEYKLAKYIKISMLFLEDDDAVSAETYIKKASALLSSCKVSVHSRPSRGARARGRWPPARMPGLLALSLLCVLAAVVHLHLGEGRARNVAGVRTRCRAVSPNHTQISAVGGTAQRNSRAADICMWFGETRCPKLP